MLENIKNWLFLRKYELFALGVIFCIAFFLRTTHFSEWLRFNDDQVRDATIIDNMLQENQFPLLGPKAGGTSFQLGPAFYYLEYFSALLFGNTPEALAYPVVFFSIFSFFLYYVLARKLFQLPIALATAGIFAFSFLNIKYSRFGWNPNLTPFFSLLFLYTLYRVLSYPQKISRLWAIALGVSLGIGIQLHTILLIILPAIFIFSFLYSLVKKFPVKQIFLIAAITALVLNFPFFLSEYKNQGANLVAFLHGLQSKSSKDDGLRSKAKHAVICLVQGSAIVVSSISYNDDCDLIAKKNQKQPYFILIFLTEILFFFGGVILFLLSLWKGANQEKRTLLSLLGAYLTLFSVFLIPLGNEASIRFFITGVFLPPILLGCWLTFFMKEKIFGWVLLILIMSFLTYEHLSLFSNVYRERNVDSEYFGGNRLSDVQPVARTIASDIGAKKGSDNHYFVLEESDRVIAYLTQKEGVQSINYTSLETLASIAPNTPITAAYIIQKINEKPKKSFQTQLSRFTIVFQKTVGRFLIIKIVKTNQ